MEHINFDTAISSIELLNGISLSLSNCSHSEALFQAIETNRKHLAEFLPWVAYTKVVSDSTNYLIQSESNYMRGLELSYNIFSGEVLIGRVGLHQIDRTNNNAAIGYWLVQSEQGKGIITTACTLLLKIGFEQMNFRRIEILTATHNTKSAAIPRRLGFTHEGILRQMERHGDQYLDLNIFSLLKEEWLQ